MNKMSYSNNIETEFEATFAGIDKDEVRARLRAAGALLVRPEYVQRRIPFHLPKEKRAKGAWLRVRDEGDKITMSLKMIQGDRIEDQKELCITIDDFDRGVALLDLIGCERKSYQESKRELWQLDGVDITIDEWPFLEPFVEVEGKSEAEVRAVSQRIGFDYARALFCAVGTLYEMKYGEKANLINTEPKIVFDMKSPFT